MKKILFVFIVLFSLSANNLLLAGSEKSIQIKTGTSYNKINAMLGSPAKEITTNSFFNNKKSLYKIEEGNYCVIEYMFNRVKSILFLEQVSEKEALEKFKNK